MGVFSGRFAVVDVFCPENWAETGILFGYRCVLSRKWGENRDEILI
jgi:hypothetical protein